MRVTWADNSTGEDEFTIQRSTQSNSGFSRAGGVARGVTQFNDGGLQPGTTYYYRVRAIKNDGTQTTWSNVAAVTTTGGISTGNPGEILQLNQLGLRQFSTQVANDASATLQNGGTSLVLQNNVWVASDQRFTLNPNTVLKFDYRSNSSGEIHGIGFDTDNTPTPETIFQLAGSQPWGLNNFRYTGNGNTQSFEIPVGEFFTGDNFRLVFVNDFDNGTGNVGTFSNIEIVNGEAASTVLGPRVSADEMFGLEYIDSSTAMLFHKQGAHSADWHYLCINNDCQAGQLNNGRFERQVNVSANEPFLIEFKVQDHQQGQCITSGRVVYTNAGAGFSVTNCQ